MFLIRSTDDVVLDEICKEEKDYRESVMQRMEFVKKQAEDIQKEVSENADVFWKKAERRLKELDKIPQTYSCESEECLRYEHEDNEFYLEKHRHHSARGGDFFSFIKNLMELR